MFKLLFRAISHIIGGLKTANEHQIWLSAASASHFQTTMQVCCFSNSSLSHLEHKF
jgi:hypothetical protein